MRLTMRHYRDPNLSARPAFLPAACLPYDGFAPESGKVRRKSHGRTYGCAFRSAEGGEAPRGHVLQRRIFLSVEFLFATLSRGRAVCSTGREARDHLSPIDRAEERRVGKECRSRW